jgi:CheY-like chemotaxis protein
MINRNYHFNVNEILKKQFDAFLTAEMPNLSHCRERARKYKILIAEDNLICSKLLQYFCQTFQYQVQVVENGQQAVEEVKNNHYDLILMDIGMPILNGYEATKEIRKLDQEKGRYTFIIGQTAFSSTFDFEIDEKCFRAGMDGVISKPYDQDLLEKFLAYVLFLNPE